MAKVDMSELTPNSHKYKEQPEQAKLQKFSGKAKLKERSLGSKFRDTFIGEEIGDAKSYILFDVIVPAIKEMIVDTVENAVEMIFGVGSRRSRVKDRKSDNVSYTAYYKSSRESSNKSNREPVDRDGYNFKDVLVETRGEAEEILDILVDHIDQYYQVSVGDLIDAMDQTPKFTDYKYGWTNLKSAYVKRVRDGYLVVLPKPELLD